MPQVADMAWLSRASIDGTRVVAFVGPEFLSLLCESVAEGKVPLR